MIDSEDGERIRQRKKHRTTEETNLWYTSWNAKGHKLLKSTRESDEWDQTVAESLDRETLLLCSRATASISRRLASITGLVKTLSPGVSRAKQNGMEKGLTDQRLCRDIHAGPKEEHCLFERLAIPSRLNAGIGRSILTSYPDDEILPAKVP